MDFFTGLIFICLATLSWYILNSRVSKRRNLPPGPFNLPIVGSLHRLGPLPYISFLKLSKKYGHIFYLKLGTIPCVVLNSAEVIKEAYTSYPLEMTHKMPTIAGEHGGMYFNGILFTDYTPKVVHFRKLLNMHLLSASRIKFFENIRKQELMIMMNNIFQHAKQNHPVKMKSMLHAMNMNVVTFMLFGERFYGSTISQSVEDADKFIDTFAKALHLMVAPNISQYIPQLRWLDLNGVEKRYNEFMPGVKKYLMSILEKRRKSILEGKHSEHTAFIDILISEEDEHVSDLSKIALISDLITASVDSTANVTEWALSELINNPEMLTQCQSEIETVVGNSRWVEEGHLPRLTYLDTVIKETIRLRTPGPLAQPRICKSHMKLGGYDIPAGTAILQNFYAVAMDEKQWKDPHVFNPDRFLISDIDVFGTDYNILPFGTGRRVCPGARLGFETAKLNVATLLQGFHWECENLTMDSVYSTLMLKADPLVALPKPRMVAELYQEH